jgi:hypothetical protein
MKIELLVNGKTYPMILTSIQVIKANMLTDELVPTLLREESIRLDADVGQALGFYDMFCDAVTYGYVEGQMTSGELGDDADAIAYQILVDGKLADYASLADALA